VENQLTVDIQPVHIVVLQTLNKSKEKTMAKRGFLMRTLAGAATLALLVAGCNMADGGLFDQTALENKLEKLTPNTAQNPYTIELDSSANIDMESATARDTWAIISNTIESKEKFVVLDLRRCAASETITGNFGSIIYDNEYIKGIILPPTLTSIGRIAFFGCRYLTGVTIPNSVTSIEDSAFEGCSGLASVTIPGSVSSIGKHAFYNTSASMTNVTFGGSETSFIQDYDESFPYSESLYSVYSTGGVGTYIRNWITWTKQK
jgi:hypothetical protein